MDGPDQSAPRADAATGGPRPTEPLPGEPRPTGDPAPVQPALRRPDPTQPVAVDTARIILAGLACWVVALVVVLAVPSLHTGSRDWWPWACVTGLVLGLLGLAYVRRGRGNAAGARRG
jgi:Protein of unknown function (DUF2530)